MGEGNGREEGECEGGNGREGERVRYFDERDSRPHFLPFIHFCLILVHAQIRGSKAKNRKGRDKYHIYERITSIELITPYHHSHPGSLMSSLSIDEKRVILLAKRKRKKIKNG